MNAKGSYSFSTQKARVNSPASQGNGFLLHRVLASIINLSIYYLLFQRSSKIRVFRDRQKASLQSKWYFDYHKRFRIRRKRWIAMSEMRRKGDVEKCPACGWGLAASAYRCPKCNIFFCYKCRGVYPFMHKAIEN